MFFQLHLIVILYLGSDLLNLIFGRPKVIGIAITAGTLDNSVKSAS